MPRQLILISACMLLLSCADGVCVPFEGTEYNWNQVSTIGIGTPTSELRERIGTPVSITRISPGNDDWRFFYRCRRTSWVSAGGLKLRSGTQTMHSEAIVRIREGRVAKIIKNEGWVYEK